MKLLSIIIPAYNEPTIGALMGRLLKVHFPLPREFIVVDDGSTDGTREWIEKNAERLSIKPVFLARNMGKGAALRAGFAVAGGGVIVVQDADLEYDPQEIIPVIMPIVNGFTKVCYGSRYLNEKEHRKNKSWAIQRGFKYRMAYYGGRIVTALCNILFGSRLTDEATCYKAFDAKFLNGLNLVSNGFELEPEITAKALKMTDILEVPISYSPRTYEEGKKINWKDGAMALWTLLKYRFMD